MGLELFKELFLAKETADQLGSTGRDCCILAGVDVFNRAYNKLAVSLKGFERDAAKRLLWEIMSCSWPDEERSLAMWALLHIFFNQQPKEESELLQKELLRERDVYVKNSSQWDLLNRCQLDLEVWLNPISRDQYFYLISGLL